ncbi:hypothetical protein J6590_095120 [Homalodisca vitripennis]|nr:hypothetical protein J6590_095120 [Homalodisca vitripennis]
MYDLSRMLLTDATARLQEICLFSPTESDIVGTQQLQIGPRQAAIVTRLLRPLEITTWKGEVEMEIE